jgi:hypothetical protein
MPHRLSLRKGRQAARHVIAHLHDPAEPAERAAALEAARREIEADDDDASPSCDG